MTAVLKVGRKVAMGRKMAGVKVARRVGKTVAMRAGSKAPDMAVM